MNEQPTAMEFIEDRTFTSRLYDGFVCVAHAKEVAERADRAEAKVRQYEKAIAELEAIRNHFVSKVYYHPAKNEKLATVKCSIFENGRKL